MSFYNVKNPRNFLVRDPLAKLTSDVQELTTEMNQIRNNKPGKTLFFSYPSPNEYLEYQFATTPSDIQAFLSSNCYASYSNQTMGISTRTDILAPGEMRYITFVTNPTKDSFDNFTNPGLWQTHLFCSSNSSDIYVSVMHVAMYDYNGIINHTTFQSNQETRIIEQSSGAVEYVFNTQMDGIDIPHPQVVQYGTVIMLYNTNTLYSTSITTYYGTDNYLVEGSRVETTLNTVPVPLNLFSWKCGYWQDSLHNPLPGQCYVYDEDISEEVLMPVPFSNFYNGQYKLRMSTESFVGGDVYNWVYNQNINYVQITNARNPNQYIIGDINNMGFDYGSFNPATTYRHFNYIVKRTYSTDPSINRMFIFSLTGGNGSADVNYFYVYSSPDTDDDQCNISFVDVNPDIQAYVVLYGETPEPLSSSALDEFFHNFVDYVLADGDQVANIETMQYNFTNHFSELTLNLPSLYTNFEFLDFNGLSGSTPGLGVDLSVNLGCGRTYFPRGVNGEDSISNPGSGYQVGDTVTILGSLMGGDDGTNDAILTITEVDGAGAVISFTVEGDAKYLQNQNYINDGGDDQYDNGNYIEGSNGNISYGNGTIVYDAFATDSESFVDYNESIFVCIGLNTYNNNIFNVSGELGADGDGYTDITNYYGSFYFTFDSGNALGAKGNIEPSEVYHFSFLNTYGGVGKAKHDSTGSIKVKDTKKKERKQNRRRKWAALSQLTSSSTLKWNKGVEIDEWIEKFKQEVQTMKNRRITS